MCVVVSVSVSVCVLCCVVCTCGLLGVVTHEAEPVLLFLAEAKQVKETHLLQMDLKSGQVLGGGRERVQSEQ